MDLLECLDKSPLEKDMAKCGQSPRKGINLWRIRSSRAALTPFSTDQFQEELDKAGNLAGIKDQKIYRSDRRPACSTATRGKKNPQKFFPRRQVFHLIFVLVDCQQIVDCKRDLFV
ncbi:hypothetical protein ILYODFUR_018091 [Ilyodon furcidens]|uniref:Uncharacterized protein n=1 Tax=Ilyodon furcidens TaxID=33524 RepID=A0ABV0SM78_9TELE